MNKKIFLLLSLIFVLLFTTAATYADISQATKPSPKEAEKVEFPDYKKYLKNQSELGFEPQNYLFPSLVKILKNQFYGDITEQKMTDSVKNEIARLYKDAGKPNPLENKVLNLPEEVYEFMIKETSLPKNIIKYAAISGLMKSTDDPYTSFLTPKEQKIMMEALQSSQFGGIGVVLEVDKANGNALTVIEPIEDSPAERAGIKSGDIITEINSVPTKGLDIDVNTSKMRGEKGSPVILTIQRKGTTGKRKFTLVRDTISVKSISSKVINSDIGYIKLRSFGEQTSREFQENLAKLMSAGIKGLIIDLRNNGGGYVNAAVSISNTFLNKNAKIVSIKNKKNAEIIQTSENISPNTLPVVLLVNKFSASASEITAGAFKENYRAPLVGTKTFGKGSVQQVVPLSDGSAVKITIAHYHTPNGNDINKKGLEPDYAVEMEPKDIGSDKDKQLFKAIEILQNKNIANCQK